MGCVGFLVEGAGACVLVGGTGSCLSVGRAMSSGVFWGVCELSMIFCCCCCFCFFVLFFCCFFLWQGDIPAEGAAGDHEQFSVARV